MAAFLLATACQVKWVADYDAKLTDEIVLTARHVDEYYSDLVHTAPDSLAGSGEDARALRSKKQREVFTKKYLAIDNELYGIYLQNLARPLNENSTEIARSILEDMWRKYEGDLGTKSALLTVHRERFTRNFEALLKAEKAKEITETETN